MIQHAAYLGDFAAGAVVDIKFTTHDDTGTPATLSGSPTVEVYQTNDGTQSSAGVTLSVDFDGVTGLNHVRVTTVTDGTFYAAARDFQIVITAGTVAGVPHAGYAICGFSVANRHVQGLATGVITAAAIAADAIGASEIAADAITEIADGILKRDMSAVTGESSRSLLNALRFLRNKWSISGSTLTVTKEDDSTSAWTAALTTSGSADPVTGSDPS